MKDQIRELKEQWTSTKSEKKRAEIDVKMSALAAENPDEFETIMLELMRETNARAREVVARQQIGNVLPAVSLAYVAKTYFGKTRQWLYQRINGSIVNGKPARLSESERQTLNDAFQDIARKLAATHVS